MLRKLLPHAAIILSGMYVVFFLIDRVNSAMAFINNNITKRLLLALCIIAVIESIWLIRDERRRARQQAARAEAARIEAERRMQARERDRYYWDEPRRTNDYPRYRR